MKKLVVSLLLSAILLSVFAVFACANTGITVYVNENVLQCDTAPFIHNGRTMVPMRKIFEAYGAIVSWNGETGTVTADIEGAEIKLCIGDYNLYNSGVAETMDVAPMIVNDTTFIPVRAVSQSLGLSVEWLEDTQSVYINSPMAFGLAKGIYLPESVLDGEVVMTLGDRTYSKADYNFVYSNIYQGMAQQYGSYFGEGWTEMEVEAGKTMLDIIEESAKDQLKLMAAVLEIAEEKGLQTNEEIQKFADEQIQHVIEVLGEQSFEYILAEMQTTKDAYRRYYEFLKISELLFEKIIQPGQEAYVDASALKSEFRKNYWTVQHILVSTQDKTDEEAVALVNEIYKKLKGGKKFAELIEEYNEDPGQTKDSFYTFTTGQMVPEFEENSKLLKVGENSKQAVKTNYGYHIIKKYETDLNSEEFKSYVTLKQQELASALLQKKIESLTITVK